MANNIGMMDSAYFVGRFENLSWINSTLRFNLSKVEEAASEAVQCQLMDVVHPGIVPRSDPNSALQLSAQDSMIESYSQASQSEQTDMSKLLADPSLLTSVISSFEGVDTNDPAVKELLASVQNQSEVFVCSILRIRSYHPNGD